MRTFSVLLLILGLGFPVVGGETLSPEALVPAYKGIDQGRPRAAFGKDVILVVWSSRQGETTDVVGVRLDKNGRPLDARPFVISGAKDSQSNPTVAFGKSCFLVVWNDLRSEKDWDIYAARVSPEGKVLDPTGIRVAWGERNQSSPAVAFDGENFQVLWVNQVRGPSIWFDRKWRGGKPRLDNGAAHVYGGRISPDGRVLDGKGRRIATPFPEYITPGRLGGPSLVRLVDGLVAGARSGSRLMPFWRMTDNQKPEKVFALESKRHFFGSPVLATDGKSVLAVWTTFGVSVGRSMGTRDSGLLFIPGGDLAAMKMRKDKRWGGKRVFDKSTIQGLSQGLRHVHSPSPAWDGTGYVVAWDIVSNHITHKRGSYYSSIFMRRISAKGKPEGKDIHVAGKRGSPAARPAVVSDGKGTTFIFYERHPKTADTSIRIAFRMLKR